MKKFWITFGLCVGAGIVLAHEFWLQPSQYFAQAGNRISLKILVGEGFLGERSEGRKNRIIQYRHYTATGTTDLSPTLSGDTYGDVSVVLTSPGTHLFSFSNTPKFLTMKADSFLLYLKEDGLDAIIAARQQRGDSRKPSRELYQRCVKTLVQVGQKTDGTFAANTNLPLDIRASRNPYDQRAGQQGEFQILFGKKPVANALVRYWNRNAANRLAEEQQRSDQQGRVRFRLRSGQNMISVVHMVPASDTAQARYGRADWHSFWGSLTFGCR
ncbi:putative GH25 family protein [Spirosoma lacussanchae]|uniref:DUF4198 domain-containing protein n=1 Tax=Spirosoma lacussanchae TaxID=1884249 RepID=UPI001FE92C64|nr:DUF4198 domain-containing protein [Spirosoma lacussanchae]